MTESRAGVWFWRIWTTIGAIALIAGTYYVLREPLKIILPPLALAAIIVYLLNPFVSALERRGMKRITGTALAYLVMFGILAGLLRLIVPVFANQTTDLIDRAPEIAASVEDSVNDQLDRFNIDTRVDFDLSSDDSQNALSDFFNNNRDEILGLIRGAGGVVSRIFHMLLTLVLAPFLAFYLLIDLPKLSNGVKRFLPPGPRHEIVDVAGRIGTIVGAYFRGQLLVALFVGVATSIGLVIVGLPFWALVGFSTGLFNLVPLIGPFVGGVIGAIVALTVGDGMSQALWVIVVMTVVQQVDNHVITPNIVARTVKVHPVTVIVALAAAGSMFGISGMFVAIPFVAAAKLVFVYLAVTQFPSMTHLVDESSALFDDNGEALPDGDGTLSALGRDLRRSFDARRQSLREPAEAEVDVGDDPTSSS